jgi:hypothetical protein
MIFGNSKRVFETGSLGATLKVYQGQLDKTDVLCRNPKSECYVKRENWNKRPFSKDDLFGLVGYKMPKGYTNLKICYYFFLLSCTNADPRSISYMQKLNNNILK